MSGYFPDRHNFVRCTSVEHVYREYPRSGTKGPEDQFSQRKYLGILTRALRLWSVLLCT